MRNQLYIVSLDQNKWIELARAVAAPLEHRELSALIAQAAALVQAGRLLFPLTVANIYETQKVNDPRRRHDMASIQAAFSNGHVFRGRRKRLETEMQSALRAYYGLPALVVDRYWFLSRSFLDAFAEQDDERLAILKLPNAVHESIRNNSPASLYAYLSSVPDPVRTTAVAQFTKGSKELTVRIEERRKRHANEDISTRRKIYSALLVIDDCDFLIQCANEVGLPWKSASDFDGAAIRKLAHDVPMYHIEREIALRLEQQARPIEQNDIRDMQAMCISIPYSNLICAEKQFVSLARQAGLDKRFEVRLSTDILDLKASIDCL